MAHPDKPIPAEAQQGSLVEPGQPAQKLVIGDLPRVATPSRARPGVVGPGSELPDLVRPVSSPTPGDEIGRSPDMDTAGREAVTTVRQGLQDRGLTSREPSGRRVVRVRDGIDPKQPPVTGARPIRRQDEQEPVQAYAEPDGEVPANTYSGVLTEEAADEDVGRDDNEYPVIMTTPVVRNPHGDQRVRGARSGGRELVVGADDPAAKARVARAVIPAGVENGVDTMPPEKRWVRLFRPDEGGNGFESVDLKVLLKQGMKLTPGRDYAAHPLTNYVSEAGVLFFSENQVQKDDFIAHVVGSILQKEDARLAAAAKEGKPAERKHLLVVDANSGRSTIKAGMEAVHTGHSVEVNTTTADELAASSTPDQFNQSLATAVGDYMAKETGQKQITEASFLRVVRDTCNTLREFSEDMKKTGRVNPSINEINAALYALSHDQDINLTREEGGPFDSDLVFALRNKMTDGEVGTYREAIKAVHDYIQVQITKEDHPEYETIGGYRAASHPLLTDFPDVLIDVIPNTGTRPNSFVQDLYFRHLIVQQGDRTDDGFPCAIIISGNPSGAQINLLSDYCRARNVPLIISMDTPEDSSQFGNLRLMGPMIFGQVPKTAVPAISQALGQETSLWDVTGRSEETARNVSTQKTPKVVSTQTGTTHTAREGWFSIKHDKTRSRSTTVTPASTSITEATNTSAGVTHGYRDESYVKEQELRPLGRDEVLVLETRAGKHRIIKMDDPSYRRRAIVAAGGAPAEITTRQGHAEQLAAEIRSKRETPGSRRGRRRP